MDAAEPPGRAPGADSESEEKEREALARAQGFARAMAMRRSCRDFSAEPVHRDIIRAALETAVGAPSGVNRQPWRFVAIGDPAVRRNVRALAESEELEFYAGRTDLERMRAAKSLGLTPEKPHFEEAPWMIAVFLCDERSEDSRNYYARESVGIAAGFLLTALHQAGLATLPHVPVAEDYLRELVGAREDEELFLIVLTGHADAAVLRGQEGAMRKPFHAVATILSGESV